LQIFARPIQLKYKPQDFWQVSMAKK